MSSSPSSHSNGVRRKRRRRPTFLMAIACIAVLMAAFVVHEQQKESQHRRDEERHGRKPSASDPSSSLGASLHHHSTTEKKANGKQDLFDVNAPPNPLGEAGNSTFSLWGQQDNRLADSKKQQRFQKLRPFPVLDDEDEPVVPAATFATVVASDALLCPKNVIDYVINATDGKDECVMLTKAFEKHCTDTEEAPKASASNGIHGRRRLQEAERTTRATAKRTRGKNPIVKWQTYFHTLARSIQDPGWFQSSSFQNPKRVLAEEEKRDPESKPELSPENNETSTVATAAPTNVTKDKPKISLALPVKTGHMSDKAVTESLLLQSEDTIANLIKATNQTNNTEAKMAAAASSKAVAEAADLIQSVLNDPSSIEARACCGSILSVFHESCEEEELSDSWLFIVVLVLAVCGMVKSLIRFYQIRWLPEAAGCILVGLASGWTLSFFPHHDISFDGDWFLRIMVPPIVFEAALGINKHSFKRHIVPIVIFAVVGTLFATGLTAFIVHEGTLLLREYCETIPYIEALAFGALISSIDPIAVLSVLSNMGMTDTDTIYVLIFGESLLNDGVAIVLFQTLVHFLDENIMMDREAITAATFHFLVVALGSLFIGAASGLLCTMYFWMMHTCQTPLVEVLMFFCWALIPYYICDGIEWSGIVAVVAAGFVMDLGVVGERGAHTILPDSDITDLSPRSGSLHRRRRPLFLREGHMSSEARTHIGFVTEIVATAMETAIFAYLGLFLFSSRYHWNIYHTTIAIAGCCISRAVMIPCLSFIANSITKAQAMRDSCKNRRIMNSDPKSSGVIVDNKMQLVLWFAGLRGAMSFALVEDIPMYDAVSGEGSRLKSELKAMTSASILFTIFVLGGGTYSLMEALGMAPAPTQNNKTSVNVELTSLLASSGSKSGDELDSTEDGYMSDESPPNTNGAGVRQRSLGTQRTF